MSVSRIVGTAEVTDNATVGESNGQERNYTLNEEKALQKKLESTDRDDVVVYETGGGLRMILNTGMFELFKLSVEQYYNEENLPFKCNIVNVHDKQGNSVECQYKLSNGRQGIYTLNLYYTKSSCLINGKNPQQFIDQDLPIILKNIEDKLKSSNTSVTEYNFKISY